MTDHDPGELRPAYRTLNDPTCLLGLAIGAWGALLVAGALGYAWLQISPLPWRLNFSLVVIVLGAPAGLLILREQGTIGPGRLLCAVIGWRGRASLATAPTAEHPLRCGGVRLDSPAIEVNELDELEPELARTATRAGADLDGAPR